MAEQLETTIEAAALNANQRHFNAVGRCAAHEAGDNHGAAVVSWRFSPGTCKRAVSSSWKSVILLRSSSICEALGAEDLLRKIFADFRLKANTRPAARVTSRAKALSRSASCRTAW